MKSIAEKQTELIELYNSLDDPIMQYEFLLQLAGEVPVPDQKLKNDDTRIRNCQTDSWFIMEQKDGCLYMGVDSDALLIRGVLSIYVYLLDGRTHAQPLILWKNQQSGNSFLSAAFLCSRNYRSEYIHFVIYRPNI